MTPAATSHNCCCPALTPKQPVQLRWPVTSRVSSSSSSSAAGRRRANHLQQRRRLPAAAAAAADDSGRASPVQPLQHQQQRQAQQRANGSAGGGSGGSPRSPAVTPRPLTSAAADALRHQLDTLLPLPPRSTPATPLLAALLPLSRPLLRRWPPAALVAALRLCRCAGTSPDAGWLADWACALQQQLPALAPDTACSLVVELLALQPQQAAVVPPGLLDDALVGALKDVPSCSSSSLAAAVVAIASAELCGGVGSVSGSPGQAAVPPADAAAAAGHKGAESSSSSAGQRASNTGGGFGGLVASSSTTNSQEQQQQHGSRSSSPVGPLSSWQDVAAAAGGVDAADATAVQQRACAAEAAAAGTAAAAAAAGGGSRGRGGSASTISAAAWLAGGSARATAGSSSQLAASQLLPIATHSLTVELGQPQRLQELAPEQLACLAVAVVVLQQKLPAGWMDTYCDALHARLPALPPACLAALAACLPLLLPAGGNLRVWRALGAAVQQHGASALSADQLCELLPLVAAADLALPVQFVESVLQRIQAALPQLGLPQASRALVAAVALGTPPSSGWLDAFLLRLRAQHSSLRSESLVDVLRALAAAGALPGTAWLAELEDETQRRFGFLGPVDVASVAFLFANLGHIPSEAWRAAWAREAAKFCTYYGGADLTQVVWSAVRLGCSMDEQWLASFVEQFGSQLGSLQAWQISFTLAALQKLGGQLPRDLLDSVLAAYVATLGGGAPASPSDTTLLLATVARAQDYVASYSTTQALLEHVQAHVMQYDGQELVSLLWSLAKLHQQPEPEWLALFEEALEGQLLGLSGNQLAELMWVLAQLQHTPPAPLLQGILARSQARMASGDMAGRDAAVSLAALARLRYTPDEPWLHACLNTIHWHLRSLEPDAFAGVLVSLSQMQVSITGGDWLDNYVSLSTSRLAAMTVDSQVNFISSLAIFRAPLPRAWAAAFQLLCVQQAEAGDMTAGQLEQVIVALASLGQAPSSALLQLYCDASRPLLASTPPASLAAVLHALGTTGSQPDAEWLQAAVEQVRVRLRSFSVTQLDSVAGALAAMQAAGLKQPWLSDFVSFLREFFL